jgi:urease accessory protein
MKRLRPAAAVAFLLTLGVLSPAQAHLLGEHGGGFGAGLAHPFSGLDHLLAMIAVGFWAVQLGGRAVWLLPLAFPAAMGVGALLGWQGVPLPGVELGIACSVIALGLLVAIGVRLPLVASAGLVALFAVLHGHSHGTELPAEASPLLYAAGFMAATLILHLIGITAGLVANRPAKPILARLAGSGIAAVGVFLVATLG